MNVDVRQLVERYIAGPWTKQGLYECLRACVQRGGADGLSGVRRLFEDRYHGDVVGAEIKGPAASTLLIWGIAGLQELAQAAKDTPTFKNFSGAVRLLAAVAAGSSLPFLSFMEDQTLLERISETRAAAPEMREEARRLLRDLVLSLEDDLEVATRVGSNFSMLAGSDLGVMQELFGALAVRWTALSSRVLDDYENLINNSPDNEAVFQNFLELHPQLLDPMAIRVWPRANLFGTKVPDFVIQRSDNTYLVVEIECPGKMIVTQAGHLSAKAIFAERQATDYRNYLMNHVKDARTVFPNFEEPECVAIVGLQRGLKPSQMEALRDVQRTRHRVRVVGFDWLADRAKAISENVMRQPIEVGSARLS